MKKLTTSILACGILASGLLSASAAAHLRVSADGGINWTVIEDNGPLDIDPGVGAVEFDGPIGDWRISVSSGQSDPVIGDPSTPDMDLSTINSSTNASSLIVQYCDTDLTTFASETYINTISYNTAGTIIGSAYRDSGNVEFGTTQTYAGGAVGTSPSLTALLLSSVGPVSGMNVYSNGAVVSASGNFPNSLTIETIISHAGTGRTITDSRLHALPQPPCNCTLTFSGSPTATICAGDAIPAITANQDCGFGLVSVPVTLVSAWTNGVCPQIATLNYTATNGCGIGFPFTQTVTINCKPICAITPSVTTTQVGATNTASVADAGAGASYNWNILNGTIIAGQNTPTITWKAGTDTSIPISIMITITNQSGCFSYCSASVRLTTPPPPPFGSGDAATMGFWQNKNGQGLINGASNSPALGNWLGTTFPCLYGASAPAGNNMTGQANSVVAAFFITKFSKTGQVKQEAQILSVAFACYFTSTSLGGGTGPKGQGFNQTPGGTGAKLFNVGPYGTALGLTNNTSYTILQIMQAANAVRCGNPNAALPYDLFNSINQGGDIK